MKFEYFIIFFVYDYSYLIKNDSICSKFAAQWLISIHSE